MMTLFVVVLPMFPRGFGLPCRLAMQVIEEVVMALVIH